MAGEGQAPYPRSPILQALRAWDALALSCFAAHAAGPAILVGFCNAKTSTRIRILPRDTHWRVASSEFFRKEKFRTQWGPIRTASLLPCRIKLLLNEDIPVYLNLSEKIKQLKALKMTNKEIADS